jgi:probable F420-dependent oxidoreductase
MKFAVTLPFLDAPPNPAFLSGSAIAALGQCAEEVGFDAAALTDHPAPGERWRQAGGHDALDPFVGLAFVAAATRRLRLLTCLVVLPYRNPFLLAKSAASLDVLSDGRLELGLGAGYQKREFAALGVDFDSRNELVDEALRLLPRIWSGEPVTHQGLHHEAVDVTSRPRPAQLPHPPLWLGGNSRLTCRRVVDHGTGWMPLPNPAATAAALRSPALETVDDLSRLLDWCRSYAQSVGRPPPSEVMFSLPPLRTQTSDEELQIHLDLIEQYRAIGVTWLNLELHAPSVEAAQGLLVRYSAVVRAGQRHRPERTTP